MRTRNSRFPNNSPVTILRRRNRGRAPNIVEPELRTIVEVAPMAETQTMEELLRAPTEGYGEAIVIPKINADHFEIKTNFLQLVQASPFHSFERENPHSHISNFKRITSTLRFRGVPNDVIKLMMFPYSLEEAARIWYEKEPPNSILTWDDLMFPYSLEGAAKTWENASKMDERIDKLADQLSTLVEIVSKKVVTPAPVKAVEENCVTCGGAHSWYNCPNTDNNQASVCATTGTYNQVAPPNHVNNQMAPPGFAPVQNGPNRFFQNQASTSGTLPSNTIPNPKGEMKAITTRSGVVYERPSIPTKSSPKKSRTRCSKILPKPTTIPELDVPKNLHKENVPYPSRLNQERFREKASFAPTIRNLLMNKEKLLEFAKIPLNENCSAMLLKKLPEKLGDPGKFLILCNFLGMNVCHALADLGPRINLMPLSIWKKLSLPELTPTRMTLELVDRSITRPKGLVEDVFVKVGKFHFPTDFVVVDFEADPRVPLILGRSFLRTSRTLIDVYDGELILRDGNEQIVFHVNGISKHPQKHANESIKLVNDTCEDGFDETNNLSSGSTTSLSNPSPESFETNKSLLKKTTDEPTLVCSSPPGDNDNEEKKKEHFSTSYVEEIVPIPRESEDFLDNNKGCDLTFCDDNMIFSNSLVESKDDLVSSNDDSILKKDVQEEDFRIYSNPLFKFDDNFNSGNENPLFNEIEEDVENKNSKVFDEPLLPHTPFSDKVECFNPGDDIDEIDAFLAIEVSTNFEEGYYDSEGDVLFLESLLYDDTTYNPSPEVILDHETQNESNHETSITFSPRNDPLHHERAPRNHYKTIKIG
ncbi:reverse transcriptase domain-containing protein [Tanacetum coccineum]